jgi:hypothetical protein
MSGDVETLDIRRGREAWDGWDKRDTRDKRDRPGQRDNWP